MKTKLTIALAASLACVLLVGCGNRTKERAMGEVPDLADVDGEEAVVVDMGSSNLNSEVGEADLLQELTEAENDEVATFDLIPKDDHESSKKECDDSYDPSILDYNPDEYVTVEDYEDKLVFRMPRMGNVTESMVNDAVDELFDDYTTGTYEDPYGIAAPGKVVDLELTMYPKGELPVRASVRVKLGDGAFPKEYEDKLDGLKAGDEVERTPFTYPEDGAREDMRGQVVETDTNILAVRSFYSKTNESIAKMTNQKFQSLEDYKNHVRAKLEFENDDEAWQTLAGRVVDELEDGAEVETFPEARLEKMKVAYRNQAKKLLPDMEVSEEMVEELAKAGLGQEMILLSVAKKEGLKVTEQDCVEAAEYRRRVAGIESADAWDEYLDTYGKESVVEDALYVKVVNALLKRARIISPLQD